MAEILETKSLYYGDVNLIAKPAKVYSRKEIPIEGWRIVVSAMSSIIGFKFISAVAEMPEELRPTLHIPRTRNIEALLRHAKELGLDRIFVGVGLNTPEIEDLAKELGYNTLLLDVANGYLPNVKEKVIQLKKRGFKVITGSVHTEDGFADLRNVGTDIIRSGIAPGSVCITKEMTGFTRGTLTEILALNTAKSYFKNKMNRKVFGDSKLVPLILADGGFKYPSDIIKSFAAGADYIMGGRLFVNAEEAELRVTTDPTRKDIYYGMASALGKEDMGKTPEYIEGRLDRLSRSDLKPLQTILEDLWMAIRSGVSYGGASNLTDFIGNGTFEIMQDIKNR